MAMHLPAAWPRTDALTSGMRAAPFPVPALPQDVERNNPALASEFGSVMKNLKQLTTQIALLDRIHSIKVRCSAGSSPCSLTCMVPVLPPAVRQRRLSLPQLAGRCVVSASLADDSSMSSAVP